MNTIHIAIDGNEANIPDRVGSNVYAYQIISALYDLTAQMSNITITILLNAPALSDMPPKRSNWNYVVILPKPFWTQWALPLHLFRYKSRYSVFFTPGHYAPRKCPIPYVSSVMDTAYLEYPEQFKKADTLKLSEWTGYSVSNAKKVIAISSFTKHCVEQAYHKKTDDVVVAYPGTNITSYKITESFRKKTLRKFKIKKPYVLFVGTLQPRKNIETVIDAYETFVRLVASRSLPARGKKSTAKTVPTLVLAGKTGWLADPIIERIEKSPLKKHIVLTGFISDKEKQVLYEEAFVSTLLGLFEGFGLPPLESCYYGTPPVVSNTTSLPEVVDGAGLLVDPRDPKAVAEAYYSVYTASSSQKLIWKRRGIKQAKKFSWNASAKVILETLIDVGSPK